MALLAIAAVGQPALELAALKGHLDKYRLSPETVSFISNYVTLVPGDVIFTGTSGKTASITHGDVLEVEIDGIGILENTVA